MTNISPVIPPVIPLPFSQVDQNFVEKILWPFGLAIQPFVVGPRDLCEFSKITTFTEARDKMWKIIERSFIASDNRMNLILGPISPKEGSVIEDNLFHFLWAYRFHVKEGRMTFPQFLFTPIISNIAGSRIQGGESQDVVYQEILDLIYAEIFARIKEKTPRDKNAVSGWWLEGYQYSQGASWELGQFQTHGWNTHLPEDTNLNRLFYCSSEINVKTVS